MGNRRAWQEHLDRELARARRHGEPLCVAILDPDKFKRFNDRHGHQAGDRLLLKLAQAWRTQLRASDILARYGGEAFCLLLPASPIEAAGDRAGAPANCDTRGPDLLGGSRRLQRQ